MVRFLLLPAPKALSVVGATDVQGFKAWVKHLGVQCFYSLVEGSRESSKQVDKSLNPKP